MTTENKDLEARELKFGKAFTNNQGVPPNGFADPELQFPKSNYSYESSVNKAARGSKPNNLSIKNGIPGVSLNFQSQVMSQYPLAQVDESLSGHVIEVNDTPAGERVLLLHKLGSGIDLKPDGSVIVNSRGNRVDIVSEDYTISVEGNGNVTYYGNLNLTVTGDYNLDVKGDYNVSVGGNNILTVLGSYRKKIVGVMAEVIQKSKSSTVLQQATFSFLNGLNTFTKGLYRNHVDGDANYFHSGNTKITSEDQINISTPNANIAAENLSVFGENGTIGGENIITYSKNVYVGNHVEAETVSASSSIKSSTFHGSLKGTAEASLFAQVASGFGGGRLPAYNDTSHTPDTTATEKPTSTILKSYLYESGNGVRVVKIDPDFSLFKSIDLTESNGGISDRELSTREVRSKLKDPANGENNKFIQNQINRGKLSPQYFAPAPSSIGRIKGKGATPMTGSTSIGSDEGAMNLKKYRQTPSATSSKNKTLSPPREFNPQLQEEITLGTMLSPGIPLGKFVAAFGDSTNLRHIATLKEKKAIARNFYPQAEIIRSFQNLESFKGFNLMPVEGLYKPGPQEQSTAGSLNKLRQTGRVVSYELYNTDGEQAFEKLFDFAIWLKDNSNYDKISLYYDNFNPDGKLNGQIIVTMPEISESFTGKFLMNIETIYNGKVQSTRDLLEVLE